MPVSRPAEDERVARHVRSGCPRGRRGDLQRAAQVEVDQAVGEGDVADGTTRSTIRVPFDRPLREAEAALEPLAEDGDDDVVAGDAQVRPAGQRRS